MRWYQIIIATAGAVAAIWSLLPLIRLIGGAEQPDVRATWALWALGTTITAGLAVVLMMVSRGRLCDGLVASWRRTLGRLSNLQFLILTCAVFVLLVVVFTLFVAHGNPRNVDGFAQMFQARIFLSGRLWLEPPTPLENFATLHMILGPERWFSQFPPGQPTILAASLSLGVWWLLNPIIGALLILATYRVATWMAGETVGRVAVMLLCVSPFVLGMAGTAMNHLPAAAIGIGAAACATILTERRGLMVALMTGLLLGLMTAFRPVDAVAAAAPVALITLLATRHRVTHFLAIFAGGITGTVPLLWYNSRTTGHWLELGYTHLWGATHTLGFHDVPFGTAHTPLRAVDITGMDLHLINRDLFDLPVPLILLIAVVLFTGIRSLKVRDVVPFLGVISLMGLLFFYWHRDILYGPRLLFSAVPWIIIIVARCIHVLAGTATRPTAPVGPRFGLVTLGVAFVVGVVMLTPSRIVAYRASNPAFNYHPDRDARIAGIENAVVLVPDGWGSRLIARMWGAGISAPRSSALYGSIDACTLQLALDRAQSDETQLLPVLDSLASLDRPGVAARVTDDVNLRLPVGEPLPQECLDEIAFDRRGFLAFAPYLYLNSARLDGDIVWARDMRDRNRDLWDQYPSRRFYKYVVGGDHPTFEEVAQPAAVRSND